MIRFVVKHRINGPGTSYETLSSLHTVDADVPALEKLLSSGGYGNGFEDCELVGAELLTPKENSGGGAGG